MAQRIKVQDLVCVITGKDKGATGEVIKIDKRAQRVVVKGVNIITRHMKPTRRGEKGKIVKEEASLALSNVMPVCPETKKPCRIRVNTAENGKRVRVSTRSGQPF